MLAPVGQVTIQELCPGLSHLSSVSEANSHNAEINPSFIGWVKKRHESESVYASESDFGRSWKVLPDHPPNQNIYYANVDGLGRPINNPYIMKMIKNGSFGLPQLTVFVRNISKEEKSF